MESVLKSHGDRARTFELHRSSSHPTPVYNHSCPNSSQDSQVEYCCWGQVAACEGGALGGNTLICLGALAELVSKVWPLHPLPSLCVDADTTERESRLRFRNRASRRKTPSLSSWSAFSRDPTGLSNLIADGLSMGIGDWVSEKAEQDLIARPRRAFSSKTQTLALLVSKEEPRDRE